MTTLPTTTRQYLEAFVEKYERWGCPINTTSRQVEDLGYEPATPTIYMPTDDLKILLDLGLLVQANPRSLGAGYVPATIETFTDEGGNRVEITHHEFSTHTKINGGIEAGIRGIMTDMGLVDDNTPIDSNPTAIPHSIAQTAAAYLVAVAPAEIEELMQLEADLDSARQEIIEAREARNAQFDTLLARPYALANAGQLKAIATQIARYAPHAEKNWLIRFTRTLFGRSVELSRLTAIQASRLEIALASINRNRAYAADWNTADGELNMHYKFDLYPTDWERAKATYRECQQRFCYQVSDGRVNHPKYLTRHEAQAFSELVKSAISSIVAH